MTLTDAGPLIALIDAGESDHELCREALNGIGLPLLTTWPAFAEAMYVLGARAGWSGQHALWRMLAKNGLELAELDHGLTARIAELMERYRDHPMDLADASLVAVAEVRGLRQIFTLDAHFRSYRVRGGGFLEVLPG
ncbi:MAG: type II toxin-antitoxin system VapC family toxin [Solirubrobacteraceae bacterium]